MELFAQTKPKIKQQQDNSNIVASSNKRNGADIELPQLNNMAVAAGVDLNPDPPESSTSNSNFLKTVKTDPFTGKLNLSIPIVVPAGRKNVQPNLSLNYTSSQLNGICGKGWSLDVPLIARSTKKGMPSYTNSDTFILNMGGAEQELVDMGNNQYRQKTEASFLKIEFFNTYWLVTDKNGMKYRFGFSQDAQQNNFAWYLDRIEDQFGNYVSLEYLKDQNQLYISEINYTGNDVTHDLPSYSIVFNYEDREDLFSNYRSGFAIVTAKRLQEIVVNYSNSLVRKYVLNYQYSIKARASMLNSINIFGSDGMVSYPPITFTYTENDHTINLGHNWIEGFTGGSIFSGDFNGDGLTDVGLWGNGRTRVALSNANNFDIPQDWDGCAPISIGDFNGDGISDLFSPNIASVNWGPPPARYLIYTYLYKVAVSGGENFIVSNWSSEYQGESGDGQWGFLEGDFNGDSLTDVYVRIPFRDPNHNIPWWKKLQSNSSAFNDLGEIPFSLDAFQTGDFNSDGLTDIWQKNGNNWTIRFSNGNSFDQAQNWPVNFNDGISMAVDMNNDGFSDAVVFDKTTGNWQVAYSNGNSFITSQDNFLQDFGRDKFPLLGAYNYSGMICPGFLDEATGNWFISDVQGTPDGLLKEISNGFGGITQIEYASSIRFDNTGEDDRCDLPFSVQVVSRITTNDGRANSYTTTYSYEGGKYDTQEREFRGFNKVIMTDAENVNTITYFNQDNILAGRPYLSEIRDGDGIIYSKQEFTWDHRQINNPNDPQKFINIVFLNEQNNFIYGLNEDIKQIRTSYVYDDYGNQAQVVSYGQTDIQGDEKTQITEYIYNAQNGLLSLPKHTQLNDASNNKVSEAWFYYDNHNSIDDLPGKGLLTKEENWLYNPLNQQTMRTQLSYRYDDYGNAIQKIDQLGRVTDTSYDNILHIYPIRVTNPLGHTIITAYNFTNGAVLSIIDANNQISRNIYDALGRLVKVIGPFDTEDNPSAIYEYCLGETPTKIIKKIKKDHIDHFDLNNYLTIVSFFDGLGRLIQTKVPAQNDPNTHQSRYIIQDTQTFDYQGRVKEKYVPYFSFDPQGQFSEPDLSQPHIVIDYDVLGRVIRTLNADNSSSSVNYDGFSKTIIDENGNSTVFTTDAYNRIIQITEHYVNPDSGAVENYRTSYLYDTKNNLVQAIDNQNNQIIFTYDSLGRKIRMIDSDMGLYNYSYDLAGNLVAQIDAKGQTIEFAYDELNRLMQKRDSTNQNNPTILATHIYDDIQKQDSIGRISTIEYPDGQVEFFYDALGREIRTIKTIDSNQYEMRRTFDALSQPKVLIYPDNTTIRYTYDSVTGQIIGVASDDIQYVQEVDYNQLGQISRVVYGNGDIREYAYNPNTIRLEHLISRNQNNRILQDLTYVFDAVGNITQIQDKIHTNTQSFRYDSLNRLIQADGISYGLIDYRYDSIGNMIRNNYLNYSYDKQGLPNLGNGLSYGGPHALTSLSDGRNFIYDYNGNLKSKLLNDQIIVAYDYDVNNRLVEVRNEQQLEKTVEVTLNPGWNTFSLSVIPNDLAVTSVLNELSLSDYLQVSRLNPYTQNYEHFVKDVIYNQFNSLEYGRGYFIYISSNVPKVVHIRGRIPDEQVQVNFVSQYNFIGANFKLSGNNLIEALYMFDNQQAQFEQTQINARLNLGKGYLIRCSAPGQLIKEQQPVVARFYYDSDGGRYKKNLINSNGQILDSTIYVGDLYEVNSKNEDTVLTNHIFLGLQKICSVISGSGLISRRYYHGDHLGSSNIITNDQGEIIQLNEYYPYGLSAKEEGDNLTNYKFNGRELDNTGLYFYGARYYDPELARFITPDPTTQKIYDPQDFNRYSYCRNNPLKYTDPTGLGWKDFWKKIFKPLIAAVLAIVTVALVPSFAPLITKFGFATVALTAGAAAAGATALLDTGIGRQFVRWFAKEFFDDVLGMSPRFADFFSSLVSHTALSSALFIGLSSITMPANYTGPNYTKVENQQGAIMEYGKETLNPDNLGGTGANYIRTHNGLNPKVSFVEQGLVTSDAAFGQVPFLGKTFNILGIRHVNALVNVNGVLVDSAQFSLLDPTKGVIWGMPWTATCHQATFNTLMAGGMSAVGAFTTTLSHGSTSYLVSTSLYGINGSYGMSGIAVAGQRQSDIN
ncbi:MAG: toxin TcdB middle/N-terminal domain-containing protein [Candidatus Omnitrophota bacterium]